MKIKGNKHSIITVFFLCFTFSLLAGTVANVYLNRDTYKANYAEKLTQISGSMAKPKAIILTTYDAMLDIDSRVFNRSDFINIYGLAQRVTGNRRIYDSGSASSDVVKLDNGMLSFVMPKSVDLQKNAEKTAVLDAHLKNEGIRLLYVQLPSKISKIDNQLPTGVHDYSNENSDTMLTALKSRGVATFDLREEIFKDKLNHYSLFFRTDHHWKPETALWAAGKISDKLNSDFGFNINMNLINENSFSIKLYKNWFLGSQGKRIGQYYAGTDDFALILPKYKTDFDSTYHRINGQSFTKKGSFEDTWIFKENLKKDYFNINTYAVYSGADYPLSVCINHLLAGKKILLLRDSYTNALAPFLSLAACRELRTIDPRHFKGSITGYIEEFKPDIVLMLYYPGTLSNTMFFNF